jgi:membrane protein required for colicin V production
MPITLLDGILIGFTLVSAVLAMVRGFSREVLSVASWVAAAAAAYFFYPTMLPFVKPHIGNPKLAIGVAAAIVFLIALIVVTVITMKIADFIIDSRIGALDRTLGFLYGAARGILVVAVALLFFNWLIGDNPPGWVTHAKSRPLLDGIGRKLESMLPADPEDTVLKKFIPAPKSDEGGSDAAPATNGQTKS